ncbi:hypothetical protein [Methylomonas sp. TEB]|uniref:hypothetical protein n=1 Tax=Methylomonas sp. TEB TaxID=3398229 RepID=UPI0039F4556D
MDIKNEKAIADDNSQRSKSIALGEDLKFVMAEYDISIDDITAGYTTSKGTPISARTIRRYMNVTMKDVDSGQCYPNGIPKGFMKFICKLVARKERDSTE